MDLSSLYFRKIFPCVSLILGINPVILKSIQHSYFSMLFNLIWWTYSLITHFYFVVLSVDSLYFPWNEGKGIVYLLATVGVTSMEYIVRNLLRALFLIKSKDIESFVSFICKNYTNKLVVQSQSKTRIYKIFSCFVIIATAFNVRMENKANYEYFRAFSFEEVYEMLPFKSFTNVPFLGKLISHGHDTIEVVVIGLFYLMFILIIEQFEYTIIDLTEMYTQISTKTVQIPVSYNDDRETRDQINLDVLCSRIHFFQTACESVLGPFLLITIPTSIAIPVLQLYKALAGFDKDLFYSQWEAGVDVMIYLFRVLILVNCGNRIHSQVRIILAITLVQLAFEIDLPDKNAPKFSVEAITFNVEKDNFVSKNKFQSGKKPE
jgi:hypothetical protein